MKYIKSYEYSNNILFELDDIVIKSISKHSKDLWKVIRIYKESVDDVQYFTSVEKDNPRYLICDLQNINTGEKLIGYSCEYFIREIDYYANKYNV